MKNAFVIVDGYSSGRLLVDAFKEKFNGDENTVIVHVQSTPTPYTAMAAPEIFKYDDSIVFDSNLQNVVDALKHYHVVAVIAGQEPGVELADTLSERLDLPNSNGTKHSVARRNKYDMIRTIAEAGLAAPKFAKLSDLESILSWVNENTTYPVVIKALRSAGTDGVYISRNEAELRAAYGKLFGSESIYNEINNDVLVESFLDGAEYVVNAVSLDGAHHVCDVWKYQKKFIPGHGNVYDSEILLPAELPEVQALIEYNANVLDALGINNGPTHAEIIMTATGPVLVEVGARLSGVVLPKFNTTCCGHDQVHLTVDAYSDPDKFKATVANFPYTLKQHGMIVNTVYEGLSGKVETIDENVLSQIHALKSAFHVVIRAHVGDTINPTRTLINSPARMFLSHPDKEQVASDYESLQRLMKRLFRINVGLTSRPASLIEEIRAEKLPANDSVSITPPAAALKR